MDYHVALDTTDGFMDKSWLDAAGQKAIPDAFIVRDGKILWIGYPVAGCFEQRLSDIADGKYDADRARKYTDAEKKAEALASMRTRIKEQGVLKIEEEAEIRKLATEVESFDQELGFVKDCAPLRFDRDENGRFHASEFMDALRFSIAFNAYRNALFNGKGTEELKKKESALRAATVKSDNPEASIQFIKTEKIFNDYCAAIGPNGNRKQATALAVQLLAVSNPYLLCKFSRAILRDSNNPMRDLPLALQLAKKAADDAGGKSPFYVECYASALAESGKAADAIEWQKKAIALRGSNYPYLESMQETLHAYEAAAQKKQ